MPARREEGDASLPPAPRERRAGPFRMPGRRERDDSARAVTRWHERLSPMAAHDRLDRKSRPAGPQIGLILSFQQVSFPQVRKVAS